jgi:hypothetical protein
MRSTVVKTETARETHATLDAVTLLQTRVTSQGTNAILDALSNLSQGLSGSDILLGPLAHLAMNLSGLAVIGQEVAVHVIEMALLLVGGTVVVLVLVFHLLSVRVGLVGEQLAEQHSGRIALAGRVLLLLLGLSLLLLFGASFSGSCTVGLVLRVIAVVVAGSVGL